MKFEESRCAQRLKLFLTNQGRVVSYEDGPDPPDIVFHLGPEVWGVEHTVLCQYVSGQSTYLRKLKSTNLRDMEIPDAEILAEALHMQKNIQERTDGRRRASWSVQLWAPIAKSHRNLIENAIVKAILDDDPTSVANLPQSMVHVHRIDDGDSAIYMGTAPHPLSTVPGSSDPSYDTQATVDYCVKRALVKKQPKQSTAHCFDRYVLLLQRSYNFADSDHVSRALQHNLTLAAAFDDIFLLDGATIARVGGRANDALV